MATIVYIFSRQMETIVYVHLMVWRIGHVSTLCVVRSLFALHKILQVDLCAEWLTYRILHSYSLSFYTFKDF